MQGAFGASPFSSLGCLCHCLQDRACAPQDLSCALGGAEHFCLSAVPKEIGTCPRKCYPCHDPCRCPCPSVLHCCTEPFIHHSADLIGKTCIVHTFHPFPEGGVLPPVMLVWITRCVLFDVFWERDAILAQKDAANRQKSSLVHAVSRPPRDPQKIRCAFDALPSYVMIVQNQLLSAVSQRGDQMLNFKEPRAPERLVPLQDVLAAKFFAKRLFATSLVSPQIEHVQAQLIAAQIFSCSVNEKCFLIHL